MEGQTAYVTGGASGIGRAIVEMLVKKGLRVFIVDLNIIATKTLVASLNTHSEVARCAKVSVDDWDQQVSGFKEAVTAFGRIDYVFPIAGIGEGRWIPKKESIPEGEFAEPNLKTLDVDLKGFLWTCSLAVQQFRRQDIDTNGFRGKICAITSICGIYCVPTLPIYTTAKHGKSGFIRSYGKYLAEENITLNGVAPNIIRTAIFPPDFYDKLEGRGLICPMADVTAAFAHMMGTNNESGEIYEVGPNPPQFVKREAQPFLDEESKVSCDILYDIDHPLQEP